MAKQSVRKSRAWADPRNESDSGCLPGDHSVAPPPSDVERSGQSIDAGL